MSTRPGQESNVSRMVSFILLIAIVLLVASLFIYVMAQLLLPLFLALLLVVIFRPVHEQLIEVCWRRPSIAAGFTTLFILLIVLLPVTILLARAATEAMQISASLGEGETLPQAIIHRGGDLLGNLRGRLAEFGVELPPDQQLVRDAAAGLQSWAAPAALRTGQFLGNFIIGLIVMLVAVYFFLVDGPSMIRALMRLSPLDDRHEQKLVNEFTRMSRAVVLATLLSGIAQGSLAGVGYFVAGLGSVFLLTVATMLLALIPFVGAASVWIPCCLWLYFYEQRPTAAFLLALWGMVAVSFVDNLVKPYVLGGQANLHPLLALISVIGGVQALGPIGIFIGPMSAAFLQALLNILRSELDLMEPATPSIPPAG
jgi:predicted PurR-regulated permease PerM